ncbi:hypothetical protein HH310_12190 [Actinoplanes sp. TBRC 11911]|uniref:hypothetical protein n=1 Tax=Actinoplanes sp. TBRC 11911 TaxID=2729386 RepID=UPI00145D553F|nr:hypothetical protein [Actinoplanes sp. TBRC 11911]NMO51952.1 hypothetical protein [Actinoplanes sp. TBRC 11911]
MSQPPAQDEERLQRLARRAGSETVVILRDGRRLSVYDIAWGYDVGDAWAHVTTNISPGFEGAPVDLFVTSEVVLVVDPATDEIVYKPSSSRLT